VNKCFDSLRGEQDTKIRTILSITLRLKFCYLSITSS